MAISRLQKVVILDHLNNSAGSQKAVVLITTEGAKNTLDANKNQEFRTKAREQNLKIQLVKNSLIKRAFKDAQVPDFTGQTFLSYLLEENEKTSEVDVPKSVIEIIKDQFKDELVVLGSVVNGEFKNQEDTITLSKMPSFEDSMAMMAGSLSQVISKIATGVKEVPSGLGRAVQAVSEKKA